MLQFLDREAGWPQVATILTAGMDLSAQIEISAIQWGEIAGALRKKVGEQGQLRAMAILSQFQPRIVAATKDRAIHAAALKVDRRIAYADAFAVDLAMDSPDHVLITADYGFKPVADLAKIEFLPAK